MFLLTAKGQAYDREQGLAAGADQYLTKPFDPDDLLRRARVALGLDAGAAGVVGLRRCGRRGLLMEAAELRRLIVRHRHVAPMLSVLLASTNARVTITDTAGEVILDRQAGGAPADAPIERHPIAVEGATVGWVEGPRPSGAVAAVLSYACAREADKRALAHEALDRYRELNLIYDLADQIGATLEIDAVAEVAVTEASRLPSGGEGFIVLRAGPDGASLDARGPRGHLQRASPRS